MISLSCNLWKGGMYVHVVVVGYPVYLHIRHLVLFILLWRIVEKLTTMSHRAFRWGNRLTTHHFVGQYPTLYFWNFMDWVMGIKSFSHLCSPYVYLLKTKPVQQVVLGPRVVLGPLPSRSDSTLKRVIVHPICGQREVRGWR